MFLLARFYRILIWFSECSPHAFGEIEIQCRLELLLPDRVSLGCWHFLWLPIRIFPPRLIFHFVGSVLRSSLRSISVHRPVPTRWMQSLRQEHSSPANFFIQSWVWLQECVPREDHPLSGRRPVHLLEQESATASNFLFSLFGSPWLLLPWVRASFRSILVAVRAWVALVHRRS
jgi:hypothetical protein